MTSTKNAKSVRLIFNSRLHYSFGGWTFSFCFLFPPYESDITFGMLFGVLVSFSSSFVSLVL